MVFHHRLLFPQGRSKALSMSYDDGSEHDRRLVAIFNACGVRGTFHLTSAALGQPHRIGRDEVAELYAGHEVACHGATHADLTQLSDDAVRRELSEDQAALEALTGAPVRGLAYAFGRHDARVEGLAAAAGFAYARGVTDALDFSLPEASMRLTTTCHHVRAMEFGHRLRASDPDGPLRWLRVRGHSFELDGFLTADPSKDWDYLWAFCRSMTADDTIWHAPVIEVLDYLAAAQGLARADDGVSIHNFSSIDLWVRLDSGGAVRVPAGASLEAPELARRI